MLETLEKPTNLDTNDDPGHFVCEECSPDKALCGTDVSGHEWDDGCLVDCVVCLDLEDVPCPTCGY